MEYKKPFWETKKNPITMIRELTISQEISRINYKPLKKQRKDGN